MIKPNELRIGNRVLESNLYASFPVDFNEITITSINDIDKVIRDSQENGYSYDALYPIPLSPEWLERLGFKVGKRYNYHNFRFALNVIEGVYELQNCGFKGKNFKYVHQLQNLYFALIGEELTIQEPK